MYTIFLFASAVAVIDVMLNVKKIRSLIKIFSVLSSLFKKIDAYKLIILRLLLLLQNVDKEKECVIISDKLK